MRLQAASQRIAERAGDPGVLLLRSNFELGSAPKQPTNGSITETQKLKNNGIEKGDVVLASFERRNKELGLIKGKRVR